MALSEEGTAEVAEEVAAALTTMESKSGDVTFVEKLDKILPIVEKLEDAVKERDDKFSSSIRRSTDAVGEGLKKLRNDVRSDLQDATTEEVAALSRLDSRIAVRLPKYICMSVKHMHDFYIGIGAGAHGRIPLNDTTYLATETEKMPLAWLKNPTYFTAQTLITTQEYDLEYLLMSLRLNRGCNLNRLQTKLINMDNLHHLISDNLIIHNDNRLIATPKGRPLLNAIIRELII